MYSSDGLSVFTGRKSIIFFPISICILCLAGALCLCDLKSGAAPDIVEEKYFQTVRIRKRTASPGSSFVI